MTSLATLQDLEDIWRPITDPAEIAKYERLLGRASALLRAKAPHVDARITAGTLDPDVAAQVVAQIVKRFAANPNGASTTSETVGPYSVSTSYVDRYEGTDGSASIRGGLQVTRSDLDAIRPYVTSGRIGSFRVRAGLAPRRYVGVNGQVITGETEEILAADPDSAPFGAAFDANPCQPQETP